MNSKLMYSKKCYICGHEMLRIKSLVSNPFDTSQKVVATYYECFKCDEIIFDAEESKRLEKLANNSKTLCDWIPSIPPKEGDILTINGIEYKFTNNMFVEL